MHNPVAPAAILFSLTAIAATISIEPELPGTSASAPASAPAVVQPTPEPATSMLYWDVFHECGVP